MATAARRRYVPPAQPGAAQVCLLDAEGASRREEPAGRFLDEARSQVTNEDSAEFRFAAKPDTWQRITKFIEEEAECCPFFAFEQFEEGDDVVLRIIRPEVQDR